MADMRSMWPSKLFIIRHGESGGNIGGDFGHPEKIARLRDIDAPLSEAGEKQAIALGRWFSDQAYDGGRPQVVLTSPYVRARLTAELINAEGGFDRSKTNYIVDERLRERELGVHDRLAGSDIRALFPEQAAARKALGRFYYRPPGGESWCDVILRLRSVLDSIALHHADRRVLIVGHDIVVLGLRYLLENLSEEEILGIDGEGGVVHCGLTEYVFNSNLEPNGGLSPVRYNWTRPLEAWGAPVTSAPDHAVGAR